MLFAQSAEQGQIFNKYSAEAEEGVNLFSGTSALNRKLVTITSGNVSAAVELNYLGNVGEVVLNKNDIAPTSWVGLGWSLGHAKIISENSGTMWLGDDSYYLISASGVKYRILKSGKNSDNSDRWWIESLPYWIVNPDVNEISFEDKKYQVIVGWSIQDDAGNKYYYGDGTYKYGDNSPTIRNATEYTLAYPHTMGIIGIVDNGIDELFPSAWNLKRSEDYDGNYLEYEYDQFVEKVRTRRYIEAPFRKYMKYGENVHTNNSYTKECYLKLIKSSQGESVVFTTEQKNYVNEFLDLKGIVEKDEENFDAYIDPMERRYLSSIVVQKEIADKAGEKKQVTIKNIDFYYKPLNVVFYKKKKTNESKAVDDNSEFVKRLLMAVVESTDKGDIQKELYSYYESDFDSEKRLPLNFGALRSVKSNNCGTVEYIYKEQNLIKQNGTSGIHYDILPITKIAMGNLEDGTAYVVGLNLIKENVQVYHRINGRWKLIQNLDEDFKGKTNLAEFDRKGEFVAGDRNWFVYTNNEKSIYMPYEWNGRFWENKKEIKKAGSAEFIEIGPGYILKARNSGDWIKLTMPWNTWNGESDKLLLDTDADSDTDDRKYTAMFTSRNHFGIFFKDKSPGNSGHLKIWSFGPDKSVGQEIYDEDNLDDDNHYGFVDDNILIGGTEGRGLTGQYAMAYHFYEKNGKPAWLRQQIKEFSGSKGSVDIMAMGDGYFALRHDDHDDLSLFEYNGEKWSVVPDADERNMVNQNFDPKTEAEWDAFNGYNFFVVRMPHIKRTNTYNYIRPQRNYGIFYKEKNKWNWEYIYQAENLKVNRTSIIAGSNWFTARAKDEPLVRDVKIYNGKEWRDDADWNNFPFIWKDIEGDYFDIFDNVRSLNGDFLVLERGTDSWIVYKKRDSFTSGVSGFVVKEKIVNDPVTAKKTTYSYDYQVGIQDIYPAYDYVTKAPLIKGFAINLPNNAGRIEKELCDETGELAGVAKGQICKESYYRNDVNKGLFPLSKVEKTYKPYRGKNDSWPSFIYIDRLVEVSTTNRNQRTTEYYKYNADDINDLVKSVTVKDMNTGKIISESVNVYAAEIDEYKDLRKERRLVEKAAVYQCVPDCKNGKVVSGIANKYKKDADTENKLRISEEWAYLPAKNSRDEKFKFDWSKDNFESWKLTKSFSHYFHGIANQYVNQFDLKSSVLFDEGRSKRILASVKNAGIDEFLLMPGDTCGIKNWDEDNCKVVPLVGRIVEKNNPNEKDKDYGRFTDYAVYVSGSDKLSGKVLKAKEKQYRFSTWVQGLNSDDGKELILKVNGKSKRFPLKGKGQWEYIEWTDDKVFDANAEIFISLESSDGSEIHLQDVRFVPADAIVNVEFYDKKWNKPIASVNDRGVGNYFTYDYQGRVAKTYGENAKREVYLMTQNTYHTGTCSISEANTSLKKLEVNGIDVPITGTSGTIEMTVGNNVDELNAMWESDAEENTYYRIYKNDSNPPPQYNKDTCCAGARQLVQQFSGMSMVLDIAVSTMDSPYHIVFNKSTTGWVDYGKDLGSGTSPIFWSGDNVSGIFYLRDGDLNRAYYDGLDWNKFSEEQDLDIEYIASTMNNNSAYLFVLPDIVGGNYDSAYVKNVGVNAKGVFASTSSLRSNYDKRLVSQGNIEGVSTFSRHYRVASSKDNTESYVVYEKTIVTETDENFVDIRYPAGDTLKPVKKIKKVVRNDKSLVSKKLENNKWIDCGTILEANVDDVSLTIGPQNTPYVAYIGKSASKKVKKYLIEDPDGTYEDADINDIPDALKKEYEEEEYYVVVKHLEKNGGLNRWIGYGSIDGDILKLKGHDLIGAKKLKMASDGINVYMAVLYDESNKNARNSLKVFKLEKTSSQLNFVEIVDTFVGSSTIAYLDEGDNFDIEVNGGIPYLAFENDDNDKYVSVLKFESNRWKSVGNPAFAKVSTLKNSLDLAINNNIPYVVFRESEQSLNENRQGKIVPMKYSLNNDMDLTISSIGNKNEQSLFGKFRQYILSYQYNVPKDTEQITFDIKFSNTNDVKAFGVMNNGAVEFTWTKSSNFSELAWFDSQKAGSLSSVTVPLRYGKNKVKMLVLGENGALLTYNFVICRDYVSGLSIQIQERNGNSSFQVYKSVDGIPITSPTAHFENSSSSTVVIPDHPTYGIIPPEDGSRTKSICVDYNSDWRMIVNGCIFSKNVCFDYDFVDRVILVPDDKCDKPDVIVAGSSSSSLLESSSATSQIVFVDQEGHEKIVDIVVLDDQKTTMLGYSSSRNGLGLSSSSVSPILSSSSIAQSSSSSVLPSGSSSSVYENSSSSIIGGGSSSSILIDDKDGYGKVVHETAIPETYATLIDYKLVGRDRISVANSVTMGSGKYIAGAIDIAAGARANGTLMSYGNVFVGSRAYVHTFIVGGNKDIQQGAVITNYIEKSVDVPVVPSVPSSYGHENINVWPNNSAVLHPGLYENINVYANASVVFEPGVYYVKSLYIAPDASIDLKTDSDLIQIWINDDFSIGDRSTFYSRGGASKCFIYGNSAGYMYVGTNVNIGAYIAYPNGYVNLAPNSVLSGAIWTKSITVGANAIIR